MFVTNLKLLGIILRDVSTHEKLRTVLAFITKQGIMVATAIIQNFCIYIKVIHNPELLEMPVETTSTTLYETVKLSKWKLTQMQQALDLRVRPLPSQNADGKPVDDSIVQLNSPAFIVHHLKPGQKIPFLNEGSIVLGMRIGILLMECGWYTQSVILFSTAAEYLIPGACRAPNGDTYHILRLSCLRRLVLCCCVAGH